MRYLWASFNFLVHFLIIFFNVQSFKYEFLWKILDIQLYNTVRHWFSTKNWIFAIFLRKFLLTVFHIFHRKYTPNFQKIDFSIYPNILYICDQNFMLVPTIKLLELSDKNWDTYERLLIFWSIFWLFFSMSKVSNMNFYEKSLIYNYTTLYDIDFPRKIGFLRFFFKKVSIDGFSHFSSKIHPKFSKNRLFHIPQYIIYLWSEFYARSNNQTIRIIG